MQGQLLSEGISIIFVLALTLAFVPVVNAGIADHVVISEIQITGQTADDEFVELYNPTNAPISLNKWRLTRKTSTGTEYLLLAGFPDKNISAYGFFLIAHPSNYTGSVTPDATYGSDSYRITADNTVILYNASKEVVDKVGFGNAVDNETSSYPTNPKGGQSLQRKVNDTINEDARYGPAWDSNNNSADFFIQENPNPQNSTWTEKHGPLPPVPELPSIVLLAFGLLMLAGYVLLTKRRR